MTVRYGALTLYLLLVIGFAGCGGSKKPPQGVTDKGVTQVAVGADQSRCDYKGRKDRVAIVTRGPNADYPNIRRVYAVGTERKDGRRILRCREVDTNLDGVNDLIRTYNDEGEPLSEQADSDYDGRIDTWISFARDRVVKAEFDRNKDGKADEFKVYNQGQLTRMKRDTTFNGRLDTWQVYEKGRLKRVGVDLDGDEKVDRWYRDAELRRQEQAREQAEAEAAENEEETEQDAAGEAESKSPGAETAK